ncbi:isochorismate synthases subfamily, putative [Synechococcus sp. PCC 7335]|uniref:isochorismate synthase n=1 Tax=Synechococcus sp. (strain ATCC 29403 / PCC 7335) TaxID=91464 RepID=UPI00017EE0C3|nr:isochorismate synthase [Synechococcus sp. PCC 7335]EDX87844.1 isochorismate synthases subfamily, putative [Synechococcus sp. PCC 7335]
MPAVQHEIDSVKTSVEASRLEPTKIYQFLTDCQQQAIASNQPKIASLSFSIRAIASGAVLATLSNPYQRHFYYDSPQQSDLSRQSMVGLGCAVDFRAAGGSRFSQAQDFVQFWEAQFVYAKLDKAGLNRSRPSLPGHFFCSATFFSDSEISNKLAANATPTLQTPYFEPAYLFVPKLQVTTVETRQLAHSIATFNSLITATTDIEKTTHTIYTELNQLISLSNLPSRIRTTATVRKLKESSGRRHSHSSHYRTRHNDLTHFKSAVKVALEQLQTSQLHKVVLADVMDVEGAQPFDEVQSLQALRQNHPDCTIFSVSNGRGQSFIGASPERLLSIADGRFTTDALAGTVSRGTLPSLDIQLAQTLINSKKEQVEHRLVVEFIVRQLKLLGLTPEYDPRPKVLQLLHVQHLHTPISASITPPQSVSPLDILARLHPTPAVAGVPHQAACELIRQYETFDRGLYAAPVGWIDTQGNSEFVVGIRSALLNGQKARLYAGAGIVAGSEPAKELAEIKLKLQALLNALV